MEREKTRKQSEIGQGLIEYVLILILVAIVVVVALGILASGLANGLYQNILSVI